MSKEVPEVPKFYWWVVYKYVDQNNQVGDGVGQFFSSEPWFPIGGMRDHIQRDKNYRLAMILDWKSISPEQSAELYRCDVQAAPVKKKTKKRSGRR